MRYDDYDSYMKALGHRIGIFIRRVMFPYMNYIIKALSVFFSWMFVYTMIMYRLEFWVLVLMIICALDLTINYAASIYDELTKNAKNTKKL